ncbi:MAG: alpha/beta fold hydrolase, partial [Acidimicrobiales bacterium]
VVGRSSRPPAGWPEPTESTIDVGKIELGALIYQPPTAGAGSAPATVILLHGWADSAWSMDSVAQPLTDGHRVIGLDLRGHGRSGRGPYNMLHFVGDLRSVVEELDVDDPIIVGHSLGGQIAAQFCGLFPEVPRALVMIEGVGPPPHRLAGEDPDLMERTSTRKHVERTRAPSRTRRLASIEDAAARLRQSHPLLDPARAMMLAERNTVAVDGGQFEWRFDPESRDWFNGHHHDVAAQRWRGITCPVLVVNGADSHQRYWRFISDDPDDYPIPLAGPALEERLSHFADVRYAEIPGAGHMLPYDKPDELNVEIARFLAGL